MTSSDRLERGGATWYTYRGAARRVGRHVQRIKEWRAQGMPMEFDNDGRRIVEESVLLAEYRRRLGRWPIHQQRMNRITRNTQGENIRPSPSVPPTV